MSLFANFLSNNAENFDEDIQYERSKGFILDRSGIISDIAEALKKDQK